jgi:hypothetical protein
MIGVGVKGRNEGTGKVGGAGAGAGLWMESSGNAKDFMRVDEGAGRWRAVEGGWVADGETLREFMVGEGETTKGRVTRDMAISAEIGWRTRHTAHGELVSASGAAG